MTFTFMPSNIVFYDPMYYEPPKDRGSHRCVHCGRYKKKNAHCSLEIAVNGGWSWEHY